MDIKEKIEQGHILTRIIIEIMGSPKEHVESTLKSLVKTLKEDNSINVITSEMFDAEEKDKFFSAFTEVEILFKNVSALIGFCFDYMPSSVEVLDPDHLKYKAHDISGLLNDLLARLHKSDMIFKNLNAESKLLKENFNKLLQNTITLSLNKRMLTTERIAAAIGIDKEKLEPFLKALTEKGLLTLDENKYSLTKK